MKVRVMKFAHSHLSGLIPGGCRVRNYIVEDNYPCGGRIMTETIRYEESGGVGEVEFRKYPSIILATVTGTNENENFWILFRYITGNNHSEKKLPMTSPVITPERIAMTTPVISETNAMSFVLPASYSMKEVPEPIDTRIRISRRYPQGNWRSSGSAEKPRPVMSPRFVSGSSKNSKSQIVRL